MGYCFNEDEMNEVLKKWNEEYIVYAPVRIAGKGCFSDTDVVRYEQVKKIEEIEFEKKSDFSFKEILTPLSQTLFYFTEESIKEANPEREKGAVIFLRSCDLHAVKRLDEIYLNNGEEDYYYKRLRDHISFVLIGCQESFDNCFCVSMRSNISKDYDMALNVKDGKYCMDIKNAKWDAYLKEISGETMEVAPDFVSENQVKVKVPDDLSLDVMKSGMWAEYDSRCINCGRCNFVCPTCTCFSMQDIFYTDNGKAGERRRVQASCMVDGFTDVAGGGAYRRKNGERMRFKVLHKVYDYKKRFGYHMCVGCGRCDDICPEYISFSNCINKLEMAVKEVAEYDA